MYADEDSSLARGHLHEAAAWLGFGPVPGSSLFVLALKNAASLVGALAITSLPSLQPVSTECLLALSGTSLSARSLQRLAGAECVCAIPTQWQNSQARPAA